MVQSVYMKPREMLVSRVVAEREAVQGHLLNNPNERVAYEQQRRVSHQRLVQIGRGPYLETHYGCLGTLCEGAVGPVAAAAPMTDQGRRMVHELHQYMVRFAETGADVLERVTV